MKIDHRIVSQYKNLWIMWPKRRSNDHAWGDHGSEHSKESVKMVGGTLTIIQATGKCT